MMNNSIGLVVGLIAEVGTTPGRARALVGAGVGLISLVIGAMALLRSRRAGNGNGRNAGTGNGRNGAIAALVLGLIGMILSVVHLAGSTGFGTGGGRAGAIVALGLSLIGTILSGLTLLRSRRTD